MTDLTITRVVHASALIDFDGAMILTDPWFSQKAGYYWGEPLGVSLAELPPLAGILVSHDHYDHYDTEALRAYPHKAVPVIVKRGTAAKLQAVGFTDVTELDPWEEAYLGPVRITAAPAKHSAPQNTYVLEAGGRAVYFGGDTLLIPELAEVATRFPRLDAALLPINGLMVRPMFNHKIVMGPEDAAALTATLHPSVVVPIHYRYTAGPVRDRLLLKYSDTPEGNLRRFAAAVAARAPETAVRVLAPGEPLRAPARMEALATR